MESSVEEQFCLFYEQAKMKSEPVKKCQERIILPYIVFSFLYAIFRLISWIACLDISVASAALQMHDTC